MQGAAICVILALTVPRLILCSRKEVLCILHCIALIARFTCLTLFTAGDANNEVPITNLAKIAFPGAKRRNGCKFSSLKLYYNCTTVISELFPAHKKQLKEAEIMY